MRLEPTNGDLCKRSVGWIVGLDPQCETAEHLPPDFPGHLFPMNVEEFTAQWATLLSGPPTRQVP